MAVMMVRAGGEYAHAREHYARICDDIRVRYASHMIRAGERDKLLREAQENYEAQIKRIDGAARAQREQDLGINGAAWGQGMWDRIADAPTVVDDAEDDFTLEQGMYIMNTLKTKIVGVKFTNGNSEAAGYEKLYQYLTDDLSIKVDDYCVVVGASGAPSIVKVYEDNMINIKATKMILAKVDMETYREKLRITVQRAAALKRLEQIEAEQNAQERYKNLATRSDEARQLLELLGMMTPSTSIEGSAMETASEGVCTINNDPNESA